MTGQALRKSQEISSDDLMTRIRADIKRAAEEESSKVATFYPLKARANPKEVPPLTSSEDLLFLNQNFPLLYQLPEPVSHRPYIGPVIVKTKRFFLGLLWKVLSPYLEREQQFFEKIIRYLNFSSQTVDLKLAELFWELIRKIDIDIQGANERMDRLISEIDSTFRTFERGSIERIGEAAYQQTVQNGKIGQIAGQINTLENVARGLERTLALLGKSTLPEEAPKPSSKPLDVDYLLLENRFRGSEEEIKALVSDYVPLLENLPGPLLDIGCGRGELLELLREKNIDARGIDLDRAMVERSKAKGLNVEYADLFEYLERIPEKSLGGMIATQVVEHLSHKQIDHFLQLIKRTVIPGGTVILETINPQSVTALARNFFRDPTHIFPVHPETLRFAMEMRGFTTAEIRYRSPYPSDAVLRSVEYSPELPARWIGILEKLNDNVERLNSLLFGYQDYAVVARV